MMAMQVIDRVREAELKASEAQDSAARRAQEMVEAARAAAKKTVADAKSGAAERESAAEASARAVADATVEKRRQSAQLEAAALREKTMNLRQNIINKLVEETLV